MKNKEKYANEIIEATVRGEHISVDKQSGKILSCIEADCEKCLFFRADPATLTCRGMFSSWANAEYKEPKIFTEREKAFITLFPEIQYIARDKNNKIFGYCRKPFKDEEEGWWVYQGGGVIEIRFGTLLRFESIQWEDEEPTSREEILGESNENKARTD